MSKIFGDLKIGDRFRFTERGEVLTRQDGWSFSYENHSKFGGAAKPHQPVFPVEEKAKPMTAALARHWLHYLATDTELLQLAAKAGDLPWGQWVLDGDDSWNSLENLDHASQLALKLNMHIGIEHGVVNAFSTTDIHNFQTCNRAHLGDDKAYCRAITLCAAEHGRRMP